MTRRAFVTGATLTGAACAVSRYAAGPVLAAGLRQKVQVSPTPLVDKGFASVRQISPGVYATISDTSKGYETLCNGGFVVGKDAALVWEGFASPAGAAFQLDALRMVSKVPVQAAINSHYHFDHTFGNAHYGAAGIPLWAHAKVANLMVERYAAFQGRDKSAMTGPAEKHLQNATSETDKQHAEGDLNALKTVTGMLDRTVLALPNRSLDPAHLPLKLDLGGTEVVMETHPGHTPGDLILRVPAQNIVFTGDLLFHHSYPVTFDADVAGWVRTLDVFNRFGKDTTFVPGHGLPCGQEGIDLLRSVFSDLADHARRMAQLGAPLAEAQSRYTVPERFKDLPIFAWGFCIDQAVAQFYKAAQGGKL
jgi:glyoxylase-like metal-dependent hydrolase (beta-lactamase superfamily II)